MDAPMLNKKIEALKAELQELIQKKQQLEKFIEQKVGAHNAFVEMKNEIETPVKSNKKK